MTENFEDGKGRDVVWYAGYVVVVLTEEVLGEWDRFCEVWGDRKSVV